MNAYVGQTRDPRLVSLLAEHGIGECTVRGELLSRKRSPWFYDNGAFRDWQDGRPFDLRRWCRDQWMIRDRGMRPDFVVVPDIVADGEASLGWSAIWRGDCAEGAPAYLAVQDGMTVDRVRAFFAESVAERDHVYHGVFVGGSLEWKLDTAASWVRFAHSTGRRCHVGRVGTAERVLWASSIGADSIDSCLPLFGAHHMTRFLAAVGATRGPASEAA